MKSVSSLYICHPNKNVDKQKMDVNKGYVTIRATSNIIPLVLAVDSDSLKAGSTIYVEERLMAVEAWGSTIKKLNNTEVVLVPADKVVAFE